MFLKLSKNLSIKKVLIITLTNIGDALLTAPAIDILLRDFPDAEFTLVTSNKALSLFEGNPCFKQIICYDKKWSIFKQMKWIIDLNNNKYDVIVDFRNSFFAFLIFARYRTLPLKYALNQHRKDYHLNRLQLLYPFDHTAINTQTITPSRDDVALIDRLLVNINKPMIVIAPCAADLGKSWSVENFFKLSKELQKIKHFNIVFIGSVDDNQIIDTLMNDLDKDCINLSGQTNLVQTCELIKRSICIITNDSGPMHMAGYFNVPTIALFGPTNPDNYGPWSEKTQLVHQNKDCKRCQQKESSLPHTCMSNIQVNDVIEAFRKIDEEIS